MYALGFTADRNIQIFPRHVLVMPIYAMKWNVLLYSHYGNMPVQYMDILKKVQVGNDQEKAQSEKDSHSKNQGGKKTN